MSEYIKVLHRLHKAGAAAPTSMPEPRPTATAASTTQQTPAAPFVAVSPASSDSHHADVFKKLYDAIRLAAGGDASRRLVVAPITTRERADAVVAGLAAHVATLGYRVLIAELAMVHGRPVLRRQRDASLASLNALGLQFDGDLMPLDLSSTASQDEVTTWLDTAARSADYVLIHGSPLFDSVDAALLARVCDGLILVAAAQVTERSQLQHAAESVHAAGCRVLGTVLTNTSTPFPAWLRRLVDRPRRSAASTVSED